MPESGDLSAGAGAGPRNGIVFTDCEFTAGISAGASASSGGGGSASRSASPGGHAHAQRRWEVVIAGKRIKTVDVHAHCIVPDAAKVIVDRLLTLAR